LRTPSTSSWPSGRGSACTCMAQPTKMWCIATTSSGVKRATNSLMVVPLRPAGGGRPHRG
jgi:hypothetical protein